MTTTVNTYSATPAEAKVNANIVAGNLAPGDLKRYGANANGNSFTEDTAAHLTAIKVANAAYALGDPFAIYYPLGVTCIQASAAFSPGIPAKVYGAGPHQSTIKMAAANFDLFTWSECWRGGNYTTGKFDPTKDQAGGMARDLTIWGDQSGTHAQNAFRFRDHNDFVLLENIETYYVNGLGLSFGETLNAKEAYTRESVVRNFRTWWCGTSSTPGILANTQANGGDGTNEIDWADINIFACKGDGLVISNPVNAGGGNRLHKFSKLRVENNAGAGFRIGKKTDAGFCGIVSVASFQAPNIRPGQFAVSCANNGTKKPYSVALHDCNIGSGSGGGFELSNTQGFFADVLNLSCQQATSISGSNNYLIKYTTGKVIAQG